MTRGCNIRGRASAEAAAERKCVAVALLMPDSELPPTWQASLLRNASRYMWSRAKADPATLSATWLTWIA